MKRLKEETAGLQTQLAQKEQATEHYKAQVATQRICRLQARGRKGLPSAALSLEG